MKCELSLICGYVNETIATSELSKFNYISTENMLPNKNGIEPASSLPNQKVVKAFKKGDILISNIRPYFKKIWLAEYNGGCSNDVLVIRAKKGTNKEFLYYLLSENKFFDYVTASSKGTKMPRGDKNAIMNYLVPEFEEKEQRKIAKLLGTIDKKIKVNKKINDNLEKQVHALFRAWFVDFLPFDGQIPSNWRYVSFSDILTPRVEKSSDPSLQMFSVTDTGIHPRNEKFKKKLSMSGTKSKIIYQDDLVFGMSREILNWGVMRWPVGGVSSAYNVFSVCKDINTYYLETYMRSNIHYFKDLIRPASREGQGIDKNALMHKEILMPPENVLHSYYHHEDTLTRLIHNNIDENTRLSIIRYTLLPKLMFGEIDVSDIQL